MINIESLKSAFKTIHQRSKEQTPQNQSSFVSVLIQKLSLGNMNLQLARYASEDTLNKRRKDICNYKFID
jgi:flagellar hook-basal body complex protein FliE